MPAILLTASWYRGKPMAAEVQGHQAHTSHRDMPPFLQNSGVYDPQTTKETWQRDFFFERKGFGRDPSLRAS